MKYFGILVLFAVLGIVLLSSRFKRTAASKKPEHSSFQIAMLDPDVFSIRGFEFYIRLKSEMKDSMLVTIRDTVGQESMIYDQESYAVVLWKDFNPPEKFLKDLSGRLKTDVIWLVFQKQVDAFGYQHWQNGTCLRRLVFSCYDKERTWEEIDGTSEPWEKTAIFDESKLEKRLAFDKKLGSARQISENEEQKLRTIWHERRLQIGSSEPYIYGRDVAEAVAIAYNLPGWE